MNYSVVGMAVSIVAISIALQAQAPAPTANPVLGTWNTRYVRP